MIKRVLAILGVLLTTASFAAPLWHCTAKNSTGAEWYWYASDKKHTSVSVGKQCLPHNHKKACEIICLPPRDYWRCVSHDTVNAPQRSGTWYWTSYSKTVAINGARDACRYNSAQGGCYVDPNACAIS